MMNMDTKSSTHQDNNSTTCRQPVKVKWDYIGSYFLESRSIYYLMRTEKRLVQWRKQNKMSVTLQLGAQRNPGQMSLSHTNTKSHTHTPISQVHTDETPTASHSVMTHAIIAFPPVVRDNTGHSGVHRDYTATEGLEESSLKRLMMTNNRRY